jgi:hypothetical protein
MDLLLCRSEFLKETNPVLSLRNAERFRLVHINNILLTVLRNYTVLQYIDYITPKQALLVFSTGSVEVINNRINDFHAPFKEEDGYSLWKLDGLG